MRPVVHRLPGDQRLAAVDRDLGDRLVLHAVDPSTERPPLPHLLEIGGRRLGKQQRVAVAHQLLAGAQAADQALELRVADAEGRAVVALEEDPPPQVGVELCEMGRMDRQPTLVLLA